MAKSKEKQSTNGHKRHLLDNDPFALKSAKERPAKKAKLLDDSDSSDAEGGVTLKVNDEYAKRFEYNKKREEKHRLEEKYGKSKALQTPADDSEDSEEGVEEDDAAELLDEDLDEQVNATLQALRAKDPRIYNKEAKFYNEDDEQDDGTNEAEKEQSMTLRQYHTKNLLEGKFAADDEDDAPPKTYAQEQEDARRSLVKEMHAAAEEDGEGDDFLVAKPKPASTKKERVKITVEDVEQADKDPETFLSNFMASRAWVPSDNARFKPLESDDDSEEAAADEWEASYNLYFEDTAGTNEKIMTYARARARAVEEAQGRGDGRKGSTDPQDRGLSGRDFKIDEWKDVLEADWSDDQWEAEMQKRFGEAYYDAGDAGSDSEDGAKSSKKKVKKPKFDDDIDIKDLIPDFKDDEDERPEITLSSDEEDAEDDPGEDEEESNTTAKSSKKRKQERADAKSAARRDRRLIENLVDSNLENVANHVRPHARDILLADDSQLNEFAGLKKLAAFRDADKKKKDKKHLSKKARLRQWRKDTFGDEDGPKGGFETILGGDGKKKKKRSRKRKEGGAEI
ncbi:hypothetical protein FB567DRAFT_599805 [Paraphoma chrysanthemicola]|uniref:Kri1-like C-terminal domain-containing protein n=1 Tax=Paraphoma chrysanthemicola TaxID=798071 RepID=A0A8K0VQQ5_9PLEO|nr:hypothetical protein FB567DRAFT_599805 [Paraphoma chrysanthemicola]